MKRKMSIILLIFMGVLLIYSFSNYDFIKKTDQKSSYMKPLYPGNYISGWSIPSGEYAFKIIGGPGRVISNNSIYNGIDIFVPDNNSEMFVEGLNLEKNIYFEVNGNIEIEATTNNADIASYKRIQFDNNKPKHTLSKNSEYIVGEDFPKGIYSLTAITGNGKISIESEKLHFKSVLMGINNDKSFLMSYDNVELLSGDKLITTDVAIELSPMKYELLEYSDDTY